MVLKIFSLKTVAKKLRFCAQTTASLKKYIKTLVFEKNDNFLPKIGKKSPKIVIGTATPG
jgi:hypothetical protein